MTHSPKRTRHRKAPFTPEIENEIRSLCYAGARGQQINIRRVNELYRKYRKEYERISDEQRKKAFEDEKAKWSF